MGMVVRGLQNFLLIDQIYSHRHPEQYSNVKKQLQYKYYCRLFSYLQRIQSKDFDEAYQVGDDYQVVDTYIALDHLREYFQNLEEYEKCAVIKTFIDVLVDRGIKLPKNIL